MRKKRLLVGTSGIGGGSGLPSSRGAAAPATAHFAAGLGLDVSVENPVYSPDDSLAKAASKLQSLKALRATATHPLAQSAGRSTPAGPLQPSVAGPAPAERAPPDRAAAALPAAEPGSQTAAPPPQACDSPPVHDAAKHALQAAEAGQRLRCGALRSILPPGGRGEEGCMFSPRAVFPPPAPAFMEHCQTPGPLQ